MYLERKMSLNEIAIELGISAGTVSSWLKSDGVKLEPRHRNANAGRSSEQQAEINERIKRSIAASEARKVNPGGRPAQYPRQERICPVDEIVFIVPVNSRQRCCSVACARVNQGREFAARKEQEWLALDASTCACGQKIPYTSRNNQFCSVACFQEYGNSRKPNPANYVTFNCLNCETEVTRYRNYGSGANKYCSNACARTHTKTRRFYAVEDFDIVFESSYEAFFWGACMISGISIERFDRQHGVQWDDNPDHWYAPDFWLPTFSAAVEVKGMQDPEDANRWSAYISKTGNHLFVFDRVRLQRITGLDRLRTEIEGKLVFAMERMESMRMSLPGINLSGSASVL